MTERGKRASKSSRAVEKRGVALSVCAHLRKATPTQYAAGQEPVISATATLTQKEEP